MMAVLDWMMQSLRMKHLPWISCICLYGLLATPLSVRAQNVARPQLVQEVLDGKRDEACVSWWGFDPTDSTEFLQAAINSRAKRLVVDR